MSNNITLINISVFFLSKNNLNIFKKKTYYDKMIMYIVGGDVYMKKVGSFLFDIVIGVWLIVAIFVTICLLSYNDFKVIEFGNKSLLIMDSDELEPDFLEGDLIIVKRNSNDKINISDKIFYYNSAKNSNTLIYTGTVENKNVIDKNETTFLVDGQSVSSEFVIGKFDTVKVYHNFGTILGVFTSKWGFMFLVIFPTLFAIIYEIVAIVEAVKSSKNEV